MVRAVDLRTLLPVGLKFSTLSTYSYCTGQRNPTSAQNILKNILRSNCVAGIKILTNGFHPELNSAWNPFSRFSSALFSKKYILNPYNFAGDPARAAAIWGRVASRDATASARATRNPAYAGPGFGAAPSARLAPPSLPRLAGGAFCGHEDHLGQVQFYINLGTQVR